MDFDDTMTEADFRRPLLDATEERYLSGLQAEPDLAVDGLESSWLSRLIGLFTRGGGS